MDGHAGMCMCSACIAARLFSEGPVKGSRGNLSENAMYFHILKRGFWFVLRMLGTESRVLYMQSKGYPELSSEPFLLLMFILRQNLTKWA